MKSSSKKALLSLLVLLMSAFVLAKLIWTLVAYLWLPKQGVDVHATVAIKPLYYRPKLTPNQANRPKPVVVKKPVVAVPQSRITDIKVTGIYASGNEAVVALLYKGRNKVLATGESIGGFVLKGATARSAIFEKDGKRYEVPLSGAKSRVSAVVAPASAPAATTSTAATEQKQDRGEIRDMGDHKVIDRKLVQYYIHNFREIGRNIGIVDAREGKALKGFKVTFIRNNSDFAKLGLKRGDIIKAINGQPLTSYRAAMQIYRSAPDIDTLTMTIERGNEEMELEYEVH